VPDTTCCARGIHTELRHPYALVSDMHPGSEQAVIQFAADPALCPSAGQEHAAPLPGLEGFTCPACDHRLPTRPRQARAPARSGPRAMRPLRGSLPSARRDARCICPAVLPVSRCPRRQLVLPAARDVRGCGGERAAGLSGETARLMPGAACACTVVDTAGV
jgi:hypothetical protein